MDLDNVGLIWQQKASNVCDVKKQTCENQITAFTPDPTPRESRKDFGRRSETLDQGKSDKCDFLKRMDFGTHPHGNSLDGLCVYEMKRTLLETVIDEQYAMESMKRKRIEQSISCAGTLPLSLQVKQGSPPSGNRGIMRQSSSPTIRGSQESFQANSAIPHQSGLIDNLCKKQTLLSSPSGSTVSQNSDHLDKDFSDECVRIAPSYSCTPSTCVSSTYQYSNFHQSSMCQDHRLTPVRLQNICNETSYAGGESPARFVTHDELKINLVSRMDDSPKGPFLVDSFSGQRQSSTGRSSQQSIPLVTPPSCSGDSNHGDYSPVPQAPSDFRAENHQEYVQEHVRDSEEEVFIDVDDSGIPEESRTGLLSAHYQDVRTPQTEGLKTSLGLRANDLTNENDVLKKGKQNLFPRNLSRCEKFLSNDGIEGVCPSFDSRVTLCEKEVGECKDWVTPVKNVHWPFISNDNSGLKNSSILVSNNLSGSRETCPLRSVGIEHNESEKNSRGSSPAQRDITVSPSQRNKKESSNPHTAQVHKSEINKSWSETSGGFSHVPLSGSKRFPQETQRRVRGRRKSHVSMSKKRMCDFNSFLPKTPPSEHLYMPGAPSGGQFLSPFGYPVSYLYPYPSLPGEQGGNMPLAMSLPTLPLMTAYSLPQVNLPQPSTVCQEGTRNNQFLKAFGCAEKNKASGLTARPPFASQRFDASCHQYDQTSVNKLFQHWCTSGEKETFHADHTTNSVLTPSDTGQGGKCSKSELPTEPIKDPERTQPTPQQSNRTEISSNEELTKYFNLLFNPSEYRPKEKSTNEQRLKNDKVKNAKDSNSVRNKNNEKRQMDESKMIPKKFQKSLKQSCSANLPKRAIKIISVDLTDDDSNDHIITEEVVKDTRSEKSVPPDKNHGVLPISVIDELWSGGTLTTNVGDKMPPLPDGQVSDSSKVDHAVKNATMPGNGTDLESKTGKPKPLKPYEPKFFQSLSPDALDKAGLLESIKKWTVQDNGGHDHGVRHGDCCQDGQCSGCRNDSQNQACGRPGAEAQGSEGQANWEGGQSQTPPDVVKDDKQKMGDVEDDQKGVEDTVKEKKIPLLNAVETIIVGLLDQGVVDLSLKTRAVNSLFEDKMNGVSTPCSCGTKRPPTMSRSMLAHANALNRAAKKHAQVEANLKKSSATVVKFPVKVAPKQDVVFPEMIQEKRIWNKPVGSLSTLSKTSPLKSSTIRHYGPMQMSSVGSNGHNTSEKSTVTDKFANCPQNLKYNSPACDFQSPSLAKPQVSFVLNEYSPFSFVQDAQKMYNDYLSQKRALEMLQHQYFREDSIPLKRRRLLFGEEGRDLNGPALCSV